MKSSWEKIIEYASKPVHGTLSRKLRKGVSLQINEGTEYENAVIFLGDQFIRITEADSKKTTMNTYYDWAGISSVRTLSPSE